MKKLTSLIPVLALSLNCLGQNVINSEWNDVPFGYYNNSYIGGSSESGGTITITGSGSSMYSDDDDGGRFVYKPVSGDCDLTAIVQWPDDEGLSVGARAGLMMRETNDRGQKYMTFNRMTGNDTTYIGTIDQVRRSLYNYIATAYNKNGFTNEWVKMRMIRKGDIFTTYVDTNKLAEVWTKFNEQSLKLGENINAGIYVCVNSASTQELLTNDFNEVAVSEIVNVQTNAADGADISWLTDLPYLPTNSCQYSYNVTRAELDGTETVIATGLLTDNFSDNTLTKGSYYKYSVDATELPYVPQATTQTVAVGSSGTFRYQEAQTNLVTGTASGVTVAYYETKESVTPYAVSNSTSLAAILSPLGGETDYYKSIVDACIYVNQTDTYTFFLELDDSAEIYIDGNRIIRNWVNGGDRWTSSSPVKLEKGRAHAFRAIYYQSTSGQKFNLKWNRGGDPDSVSDVPDSAFSPVPARFITAETGNVKLNGNSIFDEANDSITIISGGEDFNDVVDSGRVVLTDSGYSFEMTTCLTSLTSSAANPTAGLTVRDDVSFDCAMLSLLAVGGNPDWTITAILRQTAGTASSTTNLTTSIASTEPICLRMTQNGSDYTLYYKTEAATTWTAVDTFNVNLSGSSICGLTTVSGDYDAPATAIFTGTSINTDNATRLLPSDDTYVQSDNSLHGSEDTMVVKHRGDSTMRESMLRFDVSGISSLNSATLRLVIAGRNDDVETQDVNLRVHHNMEWSEATMRWNTPPAGLHFPTVFMDVNDPTLVTRFPTHYTGEFIDVDVTDEVLAAVNGTGDLTFSLSATITIDETLSFYTKDYFDTEMRPCLIITTDAPCGLEAGSYIDTNNLANACIELSWSPYSSAASFTIYRSGSLEGTYSVVSSGITDTSYIDAALTPDAPYYYKVGAVTASGETLLSEAVYTRATDASSQIASEDAYVEGNTSADKVLNGTLLTCKSNYSNYSYHREPYFKFDDISGFGHARKVLLRVVPQNATRGDGLPYDPALITVNFNRMPDNTWSESSVTWNNHPVDYPPPTPQDSSAPSCDRVVASATPIGVPMLIDVTEIAHKAAIVNSDNKLSIGALRLDNQGTFNLVFHSSEASTVSYRPTLIACGINRPILPEPDTSGYYPAFAWGDYPDASAYNIYRATSKDGTYTQLTNTTETSFNDLSTQSGEVYYYKLTAITNGVETESSRPVITAVNLEETRYPVADTGVDGNDANRNFGANTTVNLKWSPTREQLFKFDVRGLDNIISARFRINVEPPDNAFIPVNIRLWADDYGDWNEYAVSYNSNYRPFNYAPQQSDMSKHLATVTIEYRAAANREIYAEADVTEAIRNAAQSGMKYLTLVYTGDPTTPDGKGYMYTAMREYSYENKRPVLILSGSTFTPPAGLIAEEANNTSTESGVTLTWRPVAGADHYVITRISPDGESTVITDDLTSASYSDVSSTFRNSGEYTYLVTAVNTDGTEVTSTVSIEMQRTLRMPIEQDTYVRCASYSNDVYGSATSMTVKRDSDGPNTIYNRIAFVQISATNNPDFAKAYLRTVLKSVNTGSMSLYAVEWEGDEGWDESTANWTSLIGSDFSSPAIPDADDPLYLDYVDINTLEIGDDVLIDITDNLKAAKARGDEFFTIQLFGGTVGGQSNFDLWTKEHANYEYEPCVIYTLPKYPVEGTILILR